MHGLRKSCGCHCHCRQCFFCRSSSVAATSSVTCHPVTTTIEMWHIQLHVIMSDVLPEAAYWQLWHCCAKACWLPMTVAKATCLRLLFCVLKAVHMPRSYTVICKSRAWALATQMTATNYMASRSFACRLCRSCTWSHACVRCVFDHHETGICWVAQVGQEARQCCLGAQLNKGTADCKLLPAATSCMCWSCS